MLILSRSALGVEAVGVGASSVLSWKSFGSTRKRRYVKRTRWERVVS